MMSVILSLSQGLLMGDKDYNFIFEITYNPNPYNPTSETRRICTFSS